MDINKLRGHLPNEVIAQLPDTMAKFHLRTPLRLAHFLAQCSHESGNFKLVRENLNYGAKGLRSVFGKYFPTDALAQAYERKPEKIASKVYGSRMGNGPEASGEGWKHRGRGYIQLTGKDNYKAFDAVVAEDILGNPDLVAVKYPLLSAAWFWNARDLNSLADKGSTDADVKAITKKINGGFNGLTDRINQFRNFYKILKNS
jgi:putative chitinase